MQRSLPSQNFGSSVAQRSGLTMIDLVVTTLIIGIMAAVATPRFAGFYNSQKTVMAAQRIIADVDRVRSWAIANSRTVHLAFAPGMNNYKTDAAGPPDPNRPGQVLQTDVSAEPYNSSIASADFGGGLMLTFNGAGIPVDPGTIVVGSGVDQLTITINPVTGKASLP